MGDTLSSVHQEPDDDEEMIFGELYRELVEADTRDVDAEEAFELVAVAKAYWCIALWDRRRWR